MSPRHSSTGPFIVAVAAVVAIVLLSLGLLVCIVFESLCFLGSNFRVARSQARWNLLGTQDLRATFCGIQRLEERFGRRWRRDLAPEQVGHTDRSSIETCVGIISL